ncbi:reverse transcriptase-like protein [Nymphaea thermarum]|nr:reverse transcriptase-like protein [Nymphaea thermarum]
MNIGGSVFLGDDILPALSAHFREFYSKPLRFRATLPDFHISPLSVSCAISLERPFLHQEIKNAVWALSSGKAPGIDGFPVEFFRTFWEVCSVDVFAFCDEFASNSVFLKEFNQATCVLVPKRLNPTDVTHFGPISILGTPYKIIAKLLSMRLAPVLPSIINHFQVAFVKGRRLQDAVVLANEVVHSLYCLRLPSFILKLDISKAFDSVSWEFLADLLTRLAFGPSIRQWIMSLVTGAQLAVSFNGKQGDFFSLERGLRQGCPLSPLLFNLVAESFSALFHHATVVGFLTPHLLPHLQTFSTIQYADDFLLFGCASRQQVVRTSLILRVFEIISGLSINSTKCHLSLIHADPATVLLAEACFGCKATSLPMDYLGLQITLSPPAPSFWNGVEQKLTDRLQDTFSSPDSVARIVQGDVQFAIRLKRRCSSAARKKNKKNPPFKKYGRSGTRSPESVAAAAGERWGISAGRGGGSSEFQSLGFRVGTGNPNKNPTQVAASAPIFRSGYPAAAAKDSGDRVPLLPYFLKGGKLFGVLYEVASVLSISYRDKKSGELKEVVNSTSNHLAEDAFVEAPLGGLRVEAAGARRRLARAIRTYEKMINTYLIVRTRCVVPPPDKEHIRKNRSFQFSLSSIRLI